MVAIVAGSGLGLFNTSLNILGSAGVWGQGVLGQAGSRMIVNAANGNLIVQARDEQVSGRGLDLLHLRTYNAKGAWNDGDGDGWRWDGERTVTFVGNGKNIGDIGTKVLRTTGDGHQTEYVWDTGRQRYVSTEGDGAHDTLVYEEGPRQWLWVDGSSRLEERYTGSTGRLASQKDVSGNVISFGYENGRLKNITDVGSGQKLELTYAPVVPGSSVVRLQKVETSIQGVLLKQVEYGYDAVGRLTTVKTDLTPTDTTDDRVYVTSYQYDSRNRITSVSQSDGSSATFQYDSSDRVTEVVDASGKQTFTYVDASTTTVTDAHGKVWTYVYDAAQQLIEVQAPPTDGSPRQRTQFHYDAQGNLDRVTDGRGHSVVYGYDASGNRTLERDALGNTVTRRYDAKNQLVAQTRYVQPDADGSGEQAPAEPQTTRYVYDGQSRLRFIVSADGRVSENRYGDASNGYGLLTRTIQYAGGRYDQSPLSPADDISLDMMAYWLISQDKSRVQQTQYDYDLTGNLSRRTDFATSNASGAGVLDAAASVTEYVYSGHGELLQTIVVRGSTRNLRTTLSSTVYDGLGRELQTIDGSGTRTTVYDDAQRRIEVTTGAGLVISKTFDTRGRLIATVQGDGDTSRVTHYVYDSAGRLRMTEDAQGNRRFSFYDAAGRLSHQVDSTGAVTAYHYDADGRTTEEVRYRARVTGTSGWVDPATGAVTKVALTVGGAGSDVVTDAEHDRRTSYAYDSAGRLTTLTDATGAVTQTSYDGTSRITMQESSDRVTRYFYDRDGLQVGVVDALGFLTENKFDAAGRLTETVRYSTRSPASGPAAAPVWLGVSNRTVAGGRAFDYRLPAAFDPNGASLSFSVVGALPAWLTFDAAGLSLKGTPPPGVASHVITLRATAGTGPTARSTDVTFQLGVGNSAPSWGPLPDSVVAAHSTGYNFVLPAANDAESGSLTYSIVDATLLPPGLDFVAAPQPRVTGVPTTAGTYVITLRVSDGQLSTERTFTIQVTNNGPRWTGVANQGAWINTPFSLTLPLPVDPDGHVLTYRVVTKPSWLNFDAGTLSGTPPALGRQAVVLEARDPFGETVRVSFTIDVGNRATTWANLTDPPPSPAGYPYLYAPPLAVDPDNQTLVYSLIGDLPAGLSFNSSNGRISGTTNAVGSFALRMRVTDPHGEFVERSVVLRLANSAPVYVGNLDNLQPFTGGTRIVIPLAGSFSDPNGDTLNYGTPWGQPTWLIYDHATNTLAGDAPNVADTLHITIGASDVPHGASKTHTFSVSIRYVSPGAPGPKPPPGGDPGDPPVLPKFVEPGKAGNTQPPALGVGATSSTDPLAAWRPSSTDGLVTRHFHDGQGRTIASLDERGFLTETVYDQEANKLRTIQYMDWISASSGETLAVLRQRAGTRTQISTTEYDSMGRVSTRIGVDGTKTRNEYDAAGRLVRVIEADGNALQRANRIRYNAFGEITGTVGGVGDAALPDTDAAIAAYGMRHEYDSLGRRIKSIDANGHATWFYYDQENRLTHSINARGEVSETVYNRFGQAESTRRYARLLDVDVPGYEIVGGAVTDSFLAFLGGIADAARDEIVLYEYDRRGALTQLTDGEGFVTTNTYTIHGQLETQTRSIAAGLTTTTQFGYDLRGQLLAQTADVGGINLNARTLYDAYGRVVQSIDGAGRITETKYEDGGRRIEVKDALDRTVRSEYDAFSRVLTRIDAMGKTTTWVYNDTTRTITISTPEGTTVTTVRNVHGETLRVTDGRGGHTEYAYDRNGRLLTTTDALGRVVAANSYDKSGRLEDSTDARGTVTHYAYDSANRVFMRQVDPDGLNLCTTYSFDGMGRQITVTEGWGSSAARVTDYKYDRKGQLTRVVVDPTGLKLSTSFSFDGVGNSIKVERGVLDQPPQQVTLYMFDALGRRIMEIQAPSEVFGAGSARERDLTTEYRYDAAGRLSRVIDAGGQSTWYIHDGAGQQTHVINAEGEVRQSWYDANGRIVQTRQYLTRLDATTLAGLGDEVAGVAVTASGADRRTRSVYDKDGRLRFSLQAVTGGLWTIAESLYDANGNVIETRRYDKFADGMRLDALDTALSPAIDVAELQAELAVLGYGAESTLANIQRTRFAYDANNRLRFTVDALGSVSENIYDVGGLRRATLRHAVRVTLASHTEATIAAAVNGADVRNQVTHYAYDQAGRLRYTVQVLAADRHLVSRQELDALGRTVRTTAYATAVGALADYETATLDQAVTTSAQDRRSAFKYDAAGRQVLSAQLLADNQYVVRKQEHDALGQVTKVTAYATVAASLLTPPVSAQDRTTQFLYDAAGRQRYAINPDGSLQETLYDATGRIIERRRFDVTLDAQVSRTLDGLDARRADRRVGDGVTRGERFVYDRLGRVTSTIDAAGLAELYEYDALGNRIAITSKSGQVTLFAHDAAGQQVFAVQVLANNEQLVSKREYDAFGQLVHAIGYATTSTALSDYSLDGLNSAVLSSAHDRRTSYAYDTTGRQLYSVQLLADNQHLVSRREYDSLGQLVRSTAYATVVGTLSSYSADELAGAVETSVLDRTTAFAYDRLGRERFVIAADGAVAETLYDALGRVTERRRFDTIPPASIARTEQALTAWRGTRAVGDGVTRGEKYTYDARDRIRTTTDARGFVETSEYDALGDRISFTNKNSHTWTYAYDALGRVHTQTAPPALMRLSNQSQPSSQALQTRIEYDTFGGVTARYEAFGTIDERVTRHTYDSLGRLTTTTAPGWYDPATGRVERYEGPGRFQRTIEVAYDALGNQVRSSTRTGPGVSDFITSYRTYDRLGRLVHDIDALRNVTTFDYTRFGEQRTVTRHSLAVSGAPANGQYWTAGEVAGRLVGDTGARTITTIYDKLGRKTEVTGPTVNGTYYESGASPGVNTPSVTPTSGAATTLYEYNSFGEVHRERVQIDGSRWRETWHFHDAMGREVRSIDALGHHTQRSYDELGNLEETVEYAETGASGASGIFVPPDTPVADERDRITRFIYNALDQQTEIQRKGLRYSRWDAATGVYVSVSNARNVATTVQSTTYDGLGKVRTQTDAFGQTTTTAYNALGQVIQITEPARLVAAANSVDPFRNRVMGSPVVTMTHDAFGNVVRQERSSGNGAVSGSIVTSQTFDHAGNSVTTTDGNGNVRGRRYDYAGRVVAETNTIATALGGWKTLGHTIERRYAYDKLGRQTDVLDVYRDAGVARVLGQRSMFNAFGEVEHELRVWGNADTELSNLSHARTASYEYDKAGHVLVKKAADGETRYYYDLTGKVTRQEQRGDNAAGTPKRVTETFYDLLGRATLQRLPSFSAIRTARGDVAEAVTPYTTQAYDRWGNVLVRGAGGYVLNSDGLQAGAETLTYYTYNADNQVLSEQLAAATARRADGTSYQARISHELRYDLMGRTVQELDFADNTATTVNEATLLRARSRWFDAAGQLEAQADATGIRTEYAYDAAGNRVGTRNALGNVFVDSFDKNGNVTSRSVLRQADNSAYDSRNPAQTAVVHRLNEYLYDQANRRVGSGDVMSPTVVYWSYTDLDERGLVLATRNASGTTVTYGYDALGNRTSETDGNAKSRYWQYHAENNGDYVIGRLLNSTTGANRSTYYEYNAFGQVARETYNFQTGDRRFEYHANGLLRRITDENQRGTAGMAGGIDYSRTVESVEYGYTAKGERAKESSVNERWYDDPVYEYVPAEPGTPERYILIDIVVAHVATNRVTHVSYDALGRIEKIDASGGGGQDRGVVDELSYHYDELGNRRSIDAAYRLSPTQATLTSSKWFTYDAEGRMTRVDGQLSNGQIQGGTRLTYDALGRRATAYVWAGEQSGYDSDRQANVHWQEYREERYSYNDLNLLTKVEQKLHREGRNTDTNAALPGESTPWKTTQTQVHDNRGNVVASSRYSDMKYLGVGSGAIGLPILLSTTTSTYRADGRLAHQSTVDARDAKKNSTVTNTYDSAGILTSYVYHQGGNTDQAFTNTYTITHTTDFGGYLEKQIEVTTTRAGFSTGYTTNHYDGRGRLTSQSVREGASVTSRSFTYDGEGRILTKSEQTATGGAAPGVSRKQDYTYVAGREVASIGTLAPSTFSNGYTPISAAYPSTTAGSYVVGAGDTLGSIAQAVFGDRQLWYLIAEANSLSVGPDEPLASTELGKTYRIPNVVSNVHNNDGTFRPYNPASIIGSTTPSPGLPMPPAAQCSAAGQIMATAVIIAITAVASFYTGGAAGALLGKGLLATVVGGAVGGAAGSVAGQLAGNAMGVSDDFSGREVLAAGLAGGFGGLVKGGLAAREAAGIHTSLIHPLLGDAADLAQKEILGQVANGLAGIKAEGSNGWLSDLGSRLALNAVAGDAFKQLDSGEFKWGGAFETLAHNAVSPQDGWLLNSGSLTWRTIANQAVGAFTSVAVQGTMQRWQTDSSVAATRQKQAVAAAHKGIAAFGGDLMAKAADMLTDASDLTTTWVDQLRMSLADSDTRGTLVASNGKEWAQDVCTNEPNNLIILDSGEVAEVDDAGNITLLQGEVYYAEGVSPERRLADEMNEFEDRLLRGVATEGKSYLPSYVEKLEADVAARMELATRGERLERLKQMQEDGFRRLHADVEEAKSDKFWKDFLPYRFLKGVGQGSVNAVWQPVAMTIDLTQAYVAYNLDVHFDLGWEPNFISMIGDAAEHGADRDQLLMAAVLGAHPLSSAIYQANMLYNSGADGEWGDVMERSGRILADAWIGGPALQGGLKLQTGSLTHTYYGMKSTFQGAPRGSVNGRPTFDAVSGQTLAPGLLPVSGTTQSRGLLPVSGEIRSPQSLNRPAVQPPVSGEIHSPQSISRPPNQTQTSGEIRSSQSLTRVQDLLKMAQGVNGNRRGANDTNCGPCAIALHQTMAGRPASALNRPDNPTSVLQLERQLGTGVETFANVPNGATGITNIMRGYGPERQGIVVGQGLAGSHVFNVKNVGSEVLFLDGQSGTLGGTFGNPYFYSYSLLVAPQR